MKKLLAMLLSTIMVLTLLSGCAGDGGDADTSSDSSTGADDAATDDAATDDAASGESKGTITVITMALNSDYWHMVEAGAKIAGKEFGYDVNVIGPNAESDSVGQMNMVEDAVTNKVDAIVLSPNEPNVLIPSVEKAKDAGVPMIIIDAALATDDTSLRESFIGTSNYDAGYLGGEYVASKLSEGDEVAIIRGLLGQANHDDRAQGFQDAVEAAGLVVVSVQPADSDRGKGVSVAENILQSNPDVKCFYATNDEMALGAYQAVEGVQKQDDIIVMGFDGSFGALDSIAEGKLTASIAQQPIEEGYLGVKAAVDFLEGKEVEDTIWNEVVIVDSSNVEDFRANIDERMAEAE